MYDLLPNNFVGGALAPPAPVLMINTKLGTHIHPKFKRSKVKFTAMKCPHCPAGMVCMST